MKRVTGSRRRFAEIPEDAARHNRVEAEQNFGAR